MTELQDQLDHIERLEKRNEQLETTLIELAVVAKETGRLLKHFSNNYQS